MATAALHAVVRHVRHLAGGEQLSDQQLLEQFFQGEEAAFAALLERHGPMVHGACRRVLGNVHDADDAFQAVFLILSRKARSIRRTTALASWLYGVARRVALKARAAAARRRQCQPATVARTAADPAAELTWSEGQQILDEELARLPDQFRAPLLLCCVEGLSRDEAARQLGWTLDTVKGRLERGRERLRARLVRRGLTLGAVLSAALLAAKASASLPNAILQPILETVAGRSAEGAFSEQVIALADSLSSSKLPVKAGLALALGIAGIGVGLFSMPDPPPLPAAPPAPPANAKPQAARLDALGDPLPEGAFARLGTGRFRHELMVYSIVVSPDGKRIASSGAGSRAVKLWDAATGKELHSLPRRGDTLGVAFSPDGKILISTGTPTIQLWEVATGKELRKLEGHTNGVCAVAFAPDGQTIASSSYDNTVRLWDPVAGKELAKLVGHSAGVRSLAFLAGGQALASASQDKTIVLWDLAGRKEIAKLEGHKGEIWELAASPDGSLLASASEDGTVRLWDVATRKEVQVWDDHKKPVDALAFSPDGKMLASGGGDSVIRLWDVASGKMVRQIEGISRPIRALAFTPDGKELISGAVWDSVLRFWDAQTGKETRKQTSHTGLISSLAFVGDGRHLLTGSRDDTIRLWDWAEGKELKRVEAGERFSLSADGKTLVAAKFWSPTRFLIDLPSGMVSAQIDLGEKTGAVSLSPDGKKVVAGQKDSVMLWEPGSGKEPRVLAKVAGTAGVLAFSPDGKVIAGATGDASGQKAEHPVYLWDAATGQERLQLAGHTQYLSSIAFSPDGHHIATGSWDGSARVWETATGKELHRFDGIKRWVEDVAFSPDGQFLAVADDEGGVRVLELASNGEVARFAGAQGETLGLAFTPDGSVLASGGCDCTVLFWDLTGLRKKDGLRGLKLTEAELAEAGKALAGTDAATAYRAAWRLAATDQAVGYLKKQLAPVKAIDSTRVDRLIEDLDSEEFATRTAAAKQLQELAELAEPALHKVLGKSPSAEVRKQAEQLLGNLEGPLLSAERLTQLRLLQVLERVGTKEARELIEVLANGTPEAWLTQQAKASLKRLTPR